MLNKGTGSTTLGVAVAQAAQTLENHLYGWQSNEYTLQGDDVMQGVIDYLKNATCGGNICYVIQSGSFQCVQFVKGAFAMAGDPLPASGNAIDFWDLYKNRPGWTEIPGNITPPSPIHPLSESPDPITGPPVSADQRALPLPGDMAVWSSEGNLDTDIHNRPILDSNGKDQYIVYGHIAIVVAVKPPEGDQNGTITFAQGNGVGNLFDSGKYPDRTGNLSMQPLHPDLSISTGKDYPFLGYIRQTTASTSYRLPTLDNGTSGLNFDKLFPDVKGDHRTWIPIAFIDALKHQLPNPIYFLNQIHLESGFNPDLGPNSKGAEGIAQFEPDTAKCIGVDPDTKKCISVDPMDGNQALDGAAYLMNSYYNQYLSSYAEHLNTPPTEAYAMALAAYNAGPGTVAGAVKNCPSNWRDCLGSDVTSYIHIIMDQSNA